MNVNTPNDDFISKVVGAEKVDGEKGKVPPKNSPIAATANKTAQAANPEVSETPTQVHAAIQIKPVSGQIPGSVGELAKTAANMVKKNLFPKPIAIEDSDMTPESQREYNIPVVPVPVRDETTVKPITSSDLTTTDREDDLMSDIDDSPLQKEEG